MKTKSTRILEKFREGESYSSKWVMGGFTEDRCLTKGWLSSYHVDMSHFREWGHEHKQGGSKIQVLIH